MVEFHCFQDEKNEWRWRVLDANHKSFGVSGEGYVHLADCLHGIELIQRGAYGANVMDITVDPPRLIRTGPDPSIPPSWAVQP